jgi:murein DD-endopeptidase MepM/ murein hydrolase activator NlpD
MEGWKDWLSRDKEEEEPEPPPEPSIRYGNLYVDRRFSAGINKHGDRRGGRLYTFKTTATFSPGNRHINLWGVLADNTGYLLSGMRKGQEKSYPRFVPKSGGIIVDLEKEIKIPNVDDQNALDGDNAIFLHRGSIAIGTKVPTPPPKRGENPYDLDQEFQHWFLKGSLSLESYDDFKTAYEQAKDIIINGAGRLSMANPAPGEGELSLSADHDSGTLSVVNENQLIMENWRKYLTEESCEINKACNCVDSSETDLSIEEIQKVLKDNNFLSAEVTGTCDEATRMAILDFQKHNNIQCDGCVGDETHLEMFNLGYLTSRKNGKDGIRIGLPVKKRTSRTTDITGTGQDPLRGRGHPSSRFNATSNRRYPHNGQDYSAPLGTLIYPIASGTVTAVRSTAEFLTNSRLALENAGTSVPFIDGDMRLVDYSHERIQGKNPSCGLDSYLWVQEVFASGGFKSWKEGGIWVMIRHDSLKLGGKPITAWYCHLHDLNVKEGAEVDHNSIIGTVGRTGIACNQPHLHLEVFTGVNPRATSGAATGTTFDPLKIIEN